MLRKTDYVLDAISTTVRPMTGLTTGMPNDARGLECKIAHSGSTNVIFIQLDE